MRSGRNEIKIYFFFFSLTTGSCKNAKIPECQKRTGEALRIRYKDFLTHLTDAEIDQMRAYYEEVGNGYVSYKRTTKVVDGKKKNERHIVGIQSDQNDKIMVHEQKKSKYSWNITLLAIKP